MIIEGNKIRVLRRELLRRDVLSDRPLGIKKILGQYEDFMTQDIIFIVKWDFDYFMNIINPNLLGDCKGSDYDFNEEDLDVG